MPDQNSSRKRWRKLFLFCLGIASATAFCMKWMEPDLIHNQKIFTVIGLELSYPREKIQAILSGLDPSVYQTLTYHLCFDFMFMAGVFPAVACLCMMGRTRSSYSGIRGILFMLAWLQLLAWGCDITENSWLLTWMKKQTVDSFTAYRIIVYLKWILVSAGIIFGLYFSLKKKTN